MMINIIAAGNGFYAEGNDNLFSKNVLLFKGLYTLLNIMHGRNAHRIVGPLAAITGIACDDLLHFSHSEFCQRDITFRVLLMKLLSWLLVHWPERFLSVCEIGGMTRSRISDASVSLPYWLATTVDSYLDKRIYVPSITEVQLACRYLENRGIGITSASIADVLGVNFNMGRQLRKQWRRK
jgi:hypothetical protein